MIALLAIAVAVGCYHEKDYSPTAPGNTILTLRTEPSGASIPADGLSRITLVAAIDPHAASKAVTFDTTAGSFVGGIGTTATTRTVNTDASGEARIQLQSTSVADAATVTAHIEGVGAAFTTLVITFAPVSGDTIIRFTTAPESAPADNATVSTFAVVVPSVASLVARSVTFTTTAGGFLADGAAQSVVPLDSNGIARVFLRSAPNATTARVRATIGNAVAEAVIRFDTAFPDSLAVFSSSFALKPKFSEKVTITVQALRQIGNVTPGVEVRLTATDDQNKPIGQFANSTVVIGSDGKATTDYTLGPTTYTGSITITATVPGTSVSGSTTIHVDTAP